MFITILSNYQQFIFSFYLSFVSIHLTYKLKLTLLQIIMKSTGVGQDSQFPSTYLENGVGPRYSNIKNRKNYHKSNIDYQPNNDMNNKSTNYSTNYKKDRYNNHNKQNNHGISQGGVIENQHRRSGNKYNSTERYQPRFIQQTAGLEEEYSRLHKQETMTHIITDSNDDFTSISLNNNINKNVTTETTLPQLTLKNSLSKISFCDRECYNVNDNPTKEAILKYVETKYPGLHIIDNQYVLMKPHMLKNITYHEHIITTFTNGNPYLLFLTRIDNVPCSIFIDRKVKDGYCYPKIHCVQYKFDDELFDRETIFTGELVRDVNRNFHYLISDLLVYQGEYIKSRNILARYQNIHHILDNQYTTDSSSEICPIYVKRLFQYADIKYVMTEFIPVLSYTCKGLVFHTLNNQFSDYAWILPKEKQIHVPRKHEVDAEFYRRYPEYEKFRSSDTNPLPYLTTDNNTFSSFGEVNMNNTLETINNSDNPEQTTRNRKNNFVGLDALGHKQSILTNSKYYIIPKEPIYLLAMKTDIPDIINLYTRDNLTDKLGYAFIPNLRSSQMLTNAFKSLPSGELTIPVKVAYHNVFHRWIPYEVYNSNITNLDNSNSNNYLNVVETIETLKNKMTINNINTDIDAKIQSIDDINNETHSVLV